MDIIQSYNLPLAKNRSLTSFKHKILFDFLYAYKSITNYTFKQRYEKQFYWPWISKSQITSLYNLEVKRIQAEFSMESAFAQNAFKFASDKYSSTSKAFSEQKKDSKKFK